METQVLDPQETPAESAFEDDDVVESLSETAANELDSSFIDNLEDTMSKKISQDQRKA